MPWSALGCRDRILSLLANTHKTHGPTVYEACDLLVMVKSAYVLLSFHNRSWLLVGELSSITLTKQGLPSMKQDVRTASISSSARTRRSDVLYDPANHAPAIVLSPFSNKAHQVVSICKYALEE